MTTNEKINRLKLYVDKYENTAILEYKQYYYNLLYSFIYYSEKNTTCLEQEQEYYDYINSCPVLKKLLELVRKSYRPKANKIDVIKSKIEAIQEQLNDLANIIKNY